MSINERAECMRLGVREYGFNKRPTRRKIGSELHMIYACKWLRRLVFSRNGYIRALVKHDGQKETYELGRSISSAAKGFYMLVTMAVFDDWK